MIYTTPIDQISWASVEDFCKQGVVENAFLDYKVDFPTDLARTIAAMANTLGGVILIGVDENVDGKAQLPLSGVPMQSGLSERVTNIVLTSLTPPVFPEVAVIADEAKARAIVFIRIPQSPSTPHAIRSNTRVYLRTGNRNSPEELASLDQIEWLQSRRAKSVELRSRLYQAALMRSDIVFGLVERSQGVRVTKPGIPPANLTLSAIPQFPFTQLKTPPEIKVLFPSVRVRDYYGTDSEFPIGGSNLMLLQDGGNVFFSGVGEGLTRGYYTELNIFGQFFYRQTLAAMVNKKPLIRASELFCRLDEFCASAKKYFAALGYQGYVQLSALLHGAHGAALGHWEPNEIGTYTSTCPDETVHFETSFLASDWSMEAERAAFLVVQKICWAYDWDVPLGHVQTYYKNYRIR